jgi:hypothetical protein
MMIDPYEPIRQAYDDRTAIEIHLERYWFDFTTQFEKYCCRMGGRHFNANDNNGEWTDFLSNVGEDVRQALSAGFESFLEKVKHRIQSDVKSGKLAINRCPSCAKVAQTPKAKQCFWCGCDWH